MTNIQAIDLLKGLEQSLDDYCELNDEGKTAFRMAITALELFGNSEQLPPAQPERIRGRWEMKPDPYGFFDEIPVCSECGCTTEMRKVYKFCPNCGADMRGEQDE